MFLVLRIKKNTIVKEVNTNHNDITDNVLSAREHVYKPRRNQSNI